MLEQDDQEAPDPDEIEYRAQTTNSQFGALAHHLRRSSILISLAAMDRVRFNRSSAIVPHEVRKLLLNAWNTERVLRFQANNFPRDFQQYTLQWAFPQAYYACFNQLQALYRATGRAETSHRASLKTFGRLCAEGKYPVQLAFHASGGLRSIAFEHVNYRPVSPPYKWDLDPASTENQIAQFLKSTRESQLEARRKDMAKEFLTSGKDPRPKLRLSAADWDRVSSSVGHTNILDLLYRKRIKSNYRDITSFLAARIEGPSIVQALVGIVDAFSLVHEYFIATAMGLREYENLGLATDVEDPARERFETGVMRLANGEIDEVDEIWGAA